MICLPSPAIEVYAESYRKILLLLISNTAQCLTVGLIEMLMACKFFSFLFERDDFFCCKRVLCSPPIELNWPLRTFWKALTDDKGVVILILLFYDFHPIEGHL